MKKKEERERREERRKFCFLSNSLTYNTFKIRFFCLDDVIIKSILYYFHAELNPDQVKELDLNAVRNITMQDFRDSLKRIRRSVSPVSLAAYEKWSLEYGDVSL